MVLVAGVASSFPKRTLGESTESTRIHVTDVRARDPKGFTSLHLAADKGAIVLVACGRVVHATLGSSSLLEVLHSFLPIKVHSVH